MADETAGLARDPDGPVEVVGRGRAFGAGSDRRGVHALWGSRRAARTSAIASRASATSGELLRQPLARPTSRRGCWPTMTRGSRSAYAELGSAKIAASRATIERSTDGHSVLSLVRHAPTRVRSRSSGGRFFVTVSSTSCGASSWCSAPDEAEEVQERREVLGHRQIHVNRRQDDEQPVDHVVRRARIPAGEVGRADYRAEPPADDQVARRDARVPEHA